MNCCICNKGCKHPLPGVHSHCTEHLGLSSSSPELTKLVIFLLSKGIITWSKCATVMGISLADLHYQYGDLINEAMMPDKHLVTVTCKHSFVSADGWSVTGSTSILCPACEKEDK